LHSLSLNAPIIFPGDVAEAPPAYLKIPIPFTRIGVSGALADGAVNIAALSFHLAGTMAFLEINQTSTVLTDFTLAKQDIEIGIFYHIYSEGQ
jgi:hypothetical protein